MRINAAIFGVSLVLLGATAQSRGNLVSDPEPSLPGVNVLGTAGPELFLEFSNVNLGISGSLVLETLNTQTAGVYVASSGSGNVVLPDYQGVVTLAGSSSGAVTGSGVGGYWYDNLVFSPESPLAVDNAGLLLVEGTDTGTADTSKFINFWGSGTVTPAGLDYTISTASDSIAAEDTINPVPLHASSEVGFAMLAGFGTLFAVRKRVGRRPNIA